MLSTSATHNIHTGDVLAVLKTLPDNYYDAVLNDAPYGLSFMGKEWDKGVPSAEVYRELLRVVKPGAMGLHFGGTRTFHRMAVNIEDAGFEIRDCLSWLYGSGFPKSHNISKALDKQDATAERLRRNYAFTAWLRSTGITAKQIDEASGSNMGAHYLTEKSQPAVATLDMFTKFAHLVPEPPEDIKVLMHERTVESENFKKREVLGVREVPAGHSFAGETHTDRTGNVEYKDTAPATPAALTWDGYGTALKPAWEPCLLVQKPLDGTFANNALTHGCGGLNIDGSRVGTDTITTTGRFPANLILDEEAAAALDLDATVGDKPGPSRFFYTAKVSTKERNAGCEHFVDAEKRGIYAQDEWTRANMGGAPYAGLPPTKNNHPTLKPIALTTYLAKLLLPPVQPGKTRRILVPFSGAGSEMIGCLLAGWDEVVGIELDPEYVRIAEARLAHWSK